MVRKSYGVGHRDRRGVHIDGLRIQGQVIRHRGCDSCERGITKSSEDGCFLPLRPVLYPEKFGLSEMSSVVAQAHVQMIDLPKDLAGHCLVVG